MSNSPFTIPEGFPELLQDFTVSVLRERPSDVVEYAVVYFTDLANRRNPNRNQSVGPSNGVAEHISSQESSTTVIEKDEEKPVEKKVSAVKFQDEAENIDDVDDDEGPPADAPAPLIDMSNLSRDDDVYSDDDYVPPANFSKGRRASVSAEPLSMEDDITNDRVIHPKTDEQRKRLQVAVKEILIFKSLDQEQREYVLDAMFEKAVPAGEKVIELGDNGDFFYVVDSGKLDCYIKINGEEKKVLTYDNTGAFGELALMYNTPRAATIIATEECVLWALDRTTFRQLVLLTTMKKRELYEEFLNAIPLLQELESYERMNLADALVTTQYKAGETIIKQGDEADSFFIIEKGTCEVKIKDTFQAKRASQNTEFSSQHTNEEVKLTELERGQYFGELALIYKKPRAASVIASTDVSCAVLDIGAFERLLGPCVEIMQRNVSNYESKLTELFGEQLSIDDLRR
ncbi:hypothetical protein ACHWQZ_G004127 [Mnemiopsis leidyi]